MGTRVPVKHGSPLMISGSILTTDLLTPLNVQWNSETRKRFKKSFARRALDRRWAFPQRSFRPILRRIWIIICTAVRRNEGRLANTFYFFLVLRRRSVTLFRMSAQEIIAELAKLKPEELRLVKEKLNRLNAEPPIPQTGWGRALSEIAGKADDLPADLPPTRSLSLRNAEALNEAGLCRYLHRTG